MKRLWIAAALIAALLGASLVNGWYTNSLTEDMNQRLSQSQRLTSQGRWAEARALTQGVYEDWQGHHFYFHTIMRHSDTDEILCALRVVMEYLELQETDQYNAANADLMTKLELLADMEQASITNVL